MELIQAQTSDLHTRTQEAQAQTTKFESEIQAHRQQMNDYTVAVVDKIGEMDKTIASANQNPMLRLGVAEKIKEIEEKITRNRGGGAKRPILEQKSVLDIETLGEGKAQYHTWSKDMKNTLDNIRPGVGDVLHWVEGLKAGQENNIKKEWEEWSHVG